VHAADLSAVAHFPCRITGPPVACCAPFAETSGTPSAAAPISNNAKFRTLTTAKSKTLAKLYWRHCRSAGEKDG
jgi:hypothetical protein